MSYPETIKHNMESLRENDVTFLNPFIALDDHKRLEGRLIEIFGELGIPKEEISVALSSWPWAKRTASAMTCAQRARKPLNG